MASHLAGSRTLEASARTSTRAVYGLGTKKSYRGQQSAGKQGLHRFAVGLGIVVTTAAIVLSFGLI